MFQSRFYLNIKLFDYEIQAQHKIVLRALLGEKAIFIQISVRAMETAHRETQGVVTDDRGPSYSAK
jgi:hypothetical protein